MTHDYFGTKHIRAYEEEDGEGRPGYGVIYPDGYTSWSPKDVFEAAYQRLDALSFGHAIEALKQGHRVSRKGWNGKGMWLILVSGNPKCELRDGSPYKLATGLDECEILPHIDMWTVDSSGRRAMLPGWLASQSDMLADDWCVVNVDGSPVGMLEFAS